MEITIVIGIGVASAALGMVLGLVLGRYVWPAQRARDTAALVTAQMEITRLGDRFQVLNRQLEQECDRTRATDAQRASAANEVKTAAMEVARLTERENALTDKIAEQGAQLANVQKQLTTEFENIANRILKANASELSASSQKVLTAIVDPLREKIQDFQKKVETTYDAETREVISLKEQIKLMVETNHAVGSQADGLTKALRGDSQVRGRWGELALSESLKLRGLRKEGNTFSQGRGLGLRSEDGGIQRPDIVIVLPEQRTMIIDSKVPLTGYKRFIAAEDDAERMTAGDRFMCDMKAHIDGLAGKRYQENAKLASHDCVLMFVPIEGALAAALTSDPDADRCLHLAV
jgi:DNA recombination protein RmuC